MGRLTQVVKLQQIDVAQVPDNFIIKPGEIVRLRDKNTQEAAVVEHNIATQQALPRSDIHYFHTPNNDTVCALPVAHMGACGALSLVSALKCSTATNTPTTFNLDHVDPQCGALDYLRGEFRR